MVIIVEVLVEVQHVSYIVPLSYANTGESSVEIHMDLRSIVLRLGMEYMF